jgi:hypothetical protein
MLVFTACLLLFSLPFVAFACLRKRPTVTINGREWVRIGGWRWYAADSGNAAAHEMVNGNAKCEQVWDFVCARKKLGLPPDTGVWRG